MMMMTMLVLSRVAWGTRLPSDVTQWMNMSSLVGGPNRHLTTNWAVLGEQCVAHSMHMLRKGPRWISVAYGDVAKELGVAGKECPQVTCLNFGARVDLLGGAAALRRYRAEEDYEEESFRAWYSRVCGHVEVGWVTSGTGLSLYWMNQGQRVSQGDLEPDVPDWRLAFIGHEFVVVDDNDDIVEHFTVTHDAIYVLRSEPTDPPPPPPRDRVLLYKTNSTDAAARHAKSKAPDPLFADMLGYWTNNANSTVLQGETRIIHAPLNAGNEWYQALLLLTSQWIEKDADFLQVVDRGVNDGIRSRFDGGGGPLTVVVGLNGKIEFECGSSSPGKRQKDADERVVLEAQDMLFYETSSSSATCKPAKTPQGRHENDEEVFVPFFFVAHFQTNEGRVALLGDDDDDAEPSVLDANGHKRDWRDVATELERPRSSKIENNLSAAAVRTSKIENNQSAVDRRSRSFADKHHRLRRNHHQRADERPLPPVNDGAQKSGKKRHFVHARKLRSRWRKVLGSFGVWMVVAAAACIFGGACCGLRRRRRRRRGRRSVRDSYSSSRPPTGSASPTHNNSRVKTLPPNIRQAARSNRGASTVERWLSGKKSADARDAEPPRRALLHHAAAHGSAAVARVVVAAGADPDIVDDAGDAPLHLAAVSGSGAVVKILLDARANPLATDALGKNALDRARECNNTGCALLLSKKIQSLRSSSALAAAGDDTHLSRRVSHCGADSSV